MFHSSGFHHICNIKCRLDCRYSPQNIFNAKNFNPHKKPISLLNVPICTQGMQRTWWPEAGTIIVTGPYSPLFDPYEGNDISVELTMFDIAFHFFLACRIKILGGIDVIKRYLDIYISLNLPILQQHVSLITYILKTVTEQHCYCFHLENSLTPYQTHLLPTQLMHDLPSVNRKLLMGYQQIVNTLWPSNDKFLVSIVSCTDFLSNITRTIA